jgi:hypothetical protein
MSKKLVFASYDYVGNSCVAFWAVFSCLFLFPFQVFFMCDRGQFFSPKPSDARMACKPVAPEAARRAYDDFGCLSLESILKIFGQAINEEQAWAVCFQSLRTAKVCLEESRSACFHVTQLSHVKLHKDGYVHRTTFFGNPSDPGLPFKLCLSFVFLRHRISRCSKEEKSYCFGLWI